MSGKHALTPPPSGDSWEEMDGLKNLDDDGVFHSCRLNMLRNNTQGSDGNDSLGSCSGSLADSEGSVSSPIAPQSACSIVIIDHDECLAVANTGTPTRPLKSISGYEDDVFLS